MRLINVLLLVALAAAACAVPLSRQAEDPAGEEASVAAGEKDCVYEGQVHKDGTRIRDPRQPCTVRYCIDARIRSTQLQCLVRDDCEPRRLEGRCCPSYDHCPPLDEIPQGPANVEGVEEGEPHMEVTVSTSTSVEITSMSASVSMEEEGQAEAQGAGKEEEDISSNEIEDSGPQEADKAAEPEAAADEASEDEKAVAPQAEAPTSIPETVEVATSFSMEMTEMTMSVSEEVGEASGQEVEQLIEAAGIQADHHEESLQLEEGSGAVVLLREGSGGLLADDSEPLLLEEGSALLADGEGSGAEQLVFLEARSGVSPVEGSGEELLSDEGSGQEAAGLQLLAHLEARAGQVQIEASGSATSDESSEGSGDQAKGTLIFDLGDGATEELADQVQSSVLEALMDEHLISGQSAADKAPLIQLEGSGVVFQDEHGSGEAAEADDTPYVSINF